VAADRIAIEIELEKIREGAPYETMRETLPKAHHHQHYPTGSPIFDVVLKDPLKPALGVVAVFTSVG
jgi:hypothetical protein